MNKIKNLIAILAFSSLMACSSLPDSLKTFSRVALDRAQTIGNALALRDAYIELDKQIRINSEAFTADEIGVLEVESQRVHKFYLTVLSLSRGGSAETILVNADDFLVSVMTVRDSIDMAILIIQPKMNSLDSDGSLAAAGFISRYRDFSLSIDLLLAKNNRVEAVKMTTSFLKAAVPVILSIVE